jgi:hypothetical protein
VPNLTRITVKGSTDKLEEENVIYCDVNNTACNP